MTVEIRPPETAELDALFDMLTAAYTADREDFPTDPDTLRRYSTHDPHGDLRNWVVLFEGGEPISAVRIFHREVGLPGGSSARIGGIGNVGTHPDHKGRGLASRVMNAAHDQMRFEGVGSALLVTDIPDFYRRLGYEVVHQPELRAELPPLVPDDETGDAPEIFGTPVPDRVRALHQETALAMGGRVLRDGAYWRRWIMDFKVRHSRLDAYQGSGTYLIGRSEEGGSAYRVFECGGDANELLSLVIRAAMGCTILKGPDEPLIRALFEGAGARVSSRERTGIMACALEVGAPGPEAFGAFLELDTF